MKKEFPDKKERSNVEQLFDQQLARQKGVNIGINKLGDFAKKRFTILLKSFKVNNNLLIILIVFFESSW